MGIGQSPLIPLYRVQADPAARFQRFGANDSQLLGKPLLAPSNPPKLAPQISQAERHPSPPHGEDLQATPNFSPSHGPDKRDLFGTDSRSPLGTKVDLMA